MAGLLNSDSSDLPNKDIPIILLIITEVITSKQPFCILVFKDGSFIPWAENKYEEYSQDDLNKKAYETHFSVSISQILKKFLREETFLPFLPRLNLLERNELRLLQLISSGEYDSITIHFKNKKMKSLEMLKEQDVKRKVVDIISENLYQDIVIKSHKGMVTRIQNRVKLKLD